MMDMTSDGARVDRDKAIQCIMFGMRDYSGASISEG